MEFNFNWSAVSGGAPYVTLSSLGIAFNSVAISKLGNPEKIIVGFDEDQFALGVKPYEGEPGVKPYEFSSRVRNGWIRIGCRDFIKYLQSLSNIEFTPSKKFIATYNVKQSVLVVLIKGEFENVNDGESTDE